MADLEATHAGLTAIVSALSDEDLSQRYGDRFPDQSSIEGEIEGDPVLLDLCAYTLEHIDMLTSMRSA